MKYLLLFAVGITAFGQSIQPSQLSCPATNGTVPIILGTNIVSSKARFICVKLDLTRFSYDSDTNTLTVSGSGGSGSPCGTNGQIQYNNSGNCGGLSVTGNGAVVLTNNPVINSPTGIIKDDVGLDQVDNTSDAAKNTATATLTNKSIDAAEINSGTLDSTLLPDVNSGTASCGDSTHSCQVAIDTKGRVTSQSVVTISGTGGGGGGLPDPGSNGVVLRTALNTTSTVTAPSGSIVGTSDTQTLTNKSIAASELNSGTIAAARLPALTGDITTTSGTVATALSVTGVTSGTYGSGTNCIVSLVVDSKGRITGINQSTTCPGSGGGGGPASSLAHGVDTSKPLTCAVGDIYISTDLAAALQLYICSSTNVWRAQLNVGGSGALLMTNGSLDINTAVIPRFQNTGEFTASQKYKAGIQYTTTGTRPTCTAALSGTHWFTNNGGVGADHEATCFFNGSIYAWSNNF